MKKRLFFMILPLVLVLAGCAESALPKDTDDHDILVYDLSDDMTSVVPSGYDIKGEGISESVRELLQRIIDGPDNNRARSAIPETITSVRFMIGQQNVIVNFDQSFNELPQMKKILCECAVTDTLCQLDDITAVGFSVDGVPVSDNFGVPVGFLTPGSFTTADGTISGTDEKMEIHLFFTDETGKRLVEKVESITYTGTVSMDRLVVEEIIAGPHGMDCFATVNPATVVNSVVTRDGICYVNLTKDFLNKKSNVSDDVMIYSIVDSLSLLGNVNKVRILIDGSSDVRLGEMDISLPLERNLELIN